MKTHTIYIYATSKKDINKNSKVLLYRYLSTSFVKKSHNKRRSVFTEPPFVCHPQPLMDDKWATNRFLAGKF